MFSDQTPNVIQQKMLILDQDMDLRHTDPRMARGDHDLRVMPGPAVPPMAVGGMGIPPALQQQQQQQPVRPPQSIPEMDP